MSVDVSTHNIFPQVTNSLSPDSIDFSPDLNKGFLLSEAEISRMLLYAPTS